ncbi:MAG: aldehyde dehydrogenase family protein, partial [bacterium]|nr:aldehyde dehydrogenase family protein [bacterium]
MELLEQNIRLLVEDVVSKLNVAGIVQESDSSQGHGIFSDMNSAIAAAGIAHQEIVKLTLETRKSIVKSMRETILEHNELLSRKAAEETGLGCWRNKLLKHELVALKTPGVEDLEAVSYTDDHGLTLVERAPYGVIGAIIPVTNPSTTVVNNGIG